jgi:hypothetical protein
MIGTRQRIDYRSGQAAVIGRTAMGYDRLMQVVTEQAMQRAMVRINRARAVLAEPLPPAPPNPAVPDHA